MMKLNLISNNFIFKLFLTQHVLLRKGSDSPYAKWVQPKVDMVVVEFEAGTKINTKDLNYKLIKPLIWWE